ncbi:DUF1489 family protein [Sphingorhabdus arenilitoris]|uniref:DUF1489 family protein n=1 Tax=Sphingorhabdus arenilitoris TaxID=1490041 RepID=A0ABV8REH9_9SPHN
MPLHITKIAYGSESPETLAAWLARGAKQNGGPGYALMTTRYMPKRVDEMTGGSLYWIHSHTIVGRSPIIGFQKNDEGRYSLLLEPRFIPVRRKAKRAHQGWRYLEEENAPPDLKNGETDGCDEMPPQMLGELTRMGLV